MFESLGGKLHSFFLAFGDYDVVAIVELPGNDAAVAMGLASVSPAERWRNTRPRCCCRAEEAVCAMKKAKKVVYTPPK